MSGNTGESPSVFHESSQKKKFWLGAGIMFGLLVLLVLTLGFAQDKDQSQHRTERYTDAKGSAGLKASITYDCDKPCKRTYDFNVYIYKDNGQQINVVRPDADGTVNVALAEGNYVMLIGKRFGNDKVFPQEPLALKNGQMLELKLDYR